MSSYHLHILLGSLTFCSHSSHNQSFLLCSLWLRKERLFWRKFLLTKTSSCLQQWIRVVTMVRRNCRLLYVIGLLRSGFPLLLVSVSLGVLLQTGIKIYKKSCHLGHWRYFFLNILFEFAEYPTLNCPMSLIQC